MGKPASPTAAQPRKWNKGDFVLLAIALIVAGAVGYVIYLSNTPEERAEEAQRHERRNEESDLIWNSIIPSERGEAVGLDLKSAVVVGEVGAMNPSECADSSHEHLVLMRVDIVPNGKAERIDLNYCVDTVARIVKPADSQTRALTQVR